MQGRKEGREGGMNDWREGRKLERIQSTYSRTLSNQRRIGVLINHGMSWEQEVAAFAKTKNA